MYKKIVVPLDGSELAEQAINPAIALAGKETEVLLLSVVQPAYPVQFAYVGEFAAVPLPTQAFVTDLTGEHSERFQKYLNGLSEKLRAAGLKVRAEVVVGSPAEGILDFVKSEGADIIVLCTHGRSGIARWYLGSVADKLLHAATVPVMLIRAKTKES